MNYKKMENLVELASRMKAVKPEIDQLLDSLAFCWDEELAETVEQVLIYRAMPALKDAFQPFDSITGEFTLGNSPAGIIGLERKQLMQGLLVVGRSGAGKTNLFTLQMCQLRNAGVPFMAFDFKQDYRHMLREYQDIIIIPWKQFRFNALRPPDGVGPDVWLQVFSDVYSHSMALLLGSKSYLLKHLHELYDKYGVFDGTDSYPSMHELAGLLAANGRPRTAKEAWYRSTVMNRLEATVLTIGCILDCETGFDLASLLDRYVVLEMDGMMEDMQNFLVEILLAWIYHYRLAKGHRGELRHCVFFDEAKRIFDVNKERQPAAGIPIIDLITERAREFGEALIVADQEPIMLTHSIKANTGTKIMLSLGDGKDIAEMSVSMGLSKEQIEHCHKLSIGEGIVKVAGKRPVPLRIEQAFLRKDVTTSEVEEHFSKLQLSFKPRVPFETALEENPLLMATNGGGLTTRAGDLLIDINKNPFTPVTERYSRLGMSRDMGNKAKAELIAKCYANEAEIKNGNRGGRVKVLEPSERGCEWLEARWYTVGHKCRGGLEHRFWQHKAKEFFESLDCRVTLEVGIGNHSVDAIAIAPDKGAIAIEIVMSQKPEQLECIRKNFGLGFIQIIVACKDKDVQEWMQNALKQNFSETEAQMVRVCLVKDFMLSDKADWLTASDSAWRNKAGELETNRAGKHESP
jgi:hypothetical protein